VDRLVVSLLFFFSHPPDPPPTSSFSARLLFVAVFSFFFVFCPFPFPSLWRKRKMNHATLGTFAERGNQIVLGTRVFRKLERLSANGPSILTCADHECTALLANRGYIYRIYETPMSHRELQLCRASRDAATRNMAMGELSREELGKTLWTLVGKPVIIEHRIDRSGNTSQMANGVILAVLQDKVTFSVYVLVQPLDNAYGRHLVNLVERAGMSGVSLHHAIYGGMLSYREISSCWRGARRGTELIAIVDLSPFFPPPPTQVWEFTLEDDFIQRDVMASGKKPRISFPPLPRRGCQTEKKRIERKTRPRFSSSYSSSAPPPLAPSFSSSFTPLRPTVSALFLFSETRQNMEAAPETKSTDSVPTSTPSPAGSPSTPLSSSSAPLALSAPPTSSSSSPPNASGGPDTTGVIPTAASADTKQVEPSGTASSDQNGQQPPIDTSPESVDNARADMDDMLQELAKIEQVPNQVLEKLYKAASVTLTAADEAVRPTAPTNENAEQLKKQVQQLETELGLLSQQMSDKIKRLPPQPKLYSSQASLERALSALEKKTDVSETQNYHLASTLKVGILASVMGDAMGYLVNQCSELQEQAGLGRGLPTMIPEGRSVPRLPQLRSTEASGTSSSSLSSSPVPPSSSSMQRQAPISRSASLSLRSNKRKTPPPPPSSTSSFQHSGTPAIPSSKRASLGGAIHERFARWNPPTTS
jgi:hypothetical protein